eukprot:604622-Rhodomonas_salina.4
MDGSVAALCFWLLGYGFAYGPTVGGFIGNGNFGIEDIHNGAGEEEGASDGWEGWFFQWAFAGAACAPSRSRARAMLAWLDLSSSRSEASQATQE